MGSPRNYASSLARTACSSLRCWTSASDWATERRSRSMPSSPSRSSSRASTTRSLAAIAQPPRPPVADEVPAVADLRGLRILIAEDNPVNQQVLTRQASRLGLVVNAVENGEAALAALAAETYDAVLMDCQMPVMDGYAATRAIRGREAAGGPRMPIVAVTANAMREDYDRCRDAGMDDFVAKPVTLAALAQAIERAVLANGRARNRRRKARSRTLSSARTARSATTASPSTVRSSPRYRRTSAALPPCRGSFACSSSSSIRRQSRFARPSKRQTTRRRRAWRTG